jgi:hypothetical protein
MLNCLRGAVDGGCTWEEEGWVEGVVPWRVLRGGGEGRGGRGEEVRENLAKAGRHAGVGEGRGREVLGMK